MGVRRKLSWCLRQGGAVDSGVGGSIYELHDRGPAASSTGAQRGTTGMAGGMRES